MDPDLDRSTVTRMYQTMVRLQVRGNTTAPEHYGGSGGLTLLAVITQAMDNIFYNAQRQGRISFYMTNTGEVRPCQGRIVFAVPWF